MPLTRSTEPLTIAPDRRLAAIFAGVGVLALAINHWSATSDGKVYPMLLFLGPFLTLLGGGGLVDPRITWAIGKHGVSFPGWIKAIATLLVLAGLGISVLLLRVYGLWR